MLSGKKKSYFLIFLILTKLRGHDKSKPSSFSTWCTSYRSGSNCSQLSLNIIPRYQGKEKLDNNREYVVAFHLLLHFWSINELAALPLLSERCPVFCQHRPDSLTPHVVVGTLHHSHPEALRRRSKSTRSFQD